MRITFNSFSQRGADKARNEDALLLDGQVHQGRVRVGDEVGLLEPRYFAVADGVSSGTLPRTASRRLLELLQLRLMNLPATASLPAVLHAVQKDYAALGVNPELRNMATTVVGARLIGNFATIFNVGDSRAYLLTNGVKGCQVSLLSRDHSIISDMVAEGQISPEAARSAASFLRGLSCQFIVDAEFDDFNVNIATHELQPAERLLLCSDGLNEVLSDVEIAALFISQTDDDLLNACRAARRAGGTDDFSVIVLALQD